MPRDGNACCVTPNEGCCATLRRAASGAALLARTPEHAHTEGRAQISPVMVARLA
jgi:hypothetical protein